MKFHETLIQNKTTNENEQFTIFMNTENRETKEPNKITHNLSQRLDVRISDKHVALSNLSTYYK